MPWKYFNGTGFFCVMMTDAKVIDLNQKMEKWNDGVLEQWSIGVMG